MIARFLSERRKLNSRSGVIILPISLLILFFFSSLVPGQNSNGALRGEVQDSSGARLPGAGVEVQSTGSSITREVTANERGEFRIEGLLPGSYKVTVSAKGFAQAAAEVEIA